MGLLDDAIREHLELKRRSGADARELARLEHAAFGPVRGGDEWADDEAAPAAEVADAPDAPFDADPPVADTAFDAPPAHEPAPVPAHEPPAAAPPEETSAHEPFVAEPEPYEEPSYEDEEPAAYEPPPLKPSEDPQATVAFTLADEVAAETPLPEDRIEPPAPAGEDYLPPIPPAPARPREGADPDVVAPDEEVHDELEETPDFLEETPEHDRLWFEQKPPRDFDF